MYKSVFFLFLILTTCYLLLSTVKALALTMTNGFYTITMGNLNSISGTPTNSSYKLGITSGETGSGLYSLNGVNYKVRAGFQYIHSLIRFSFKIQNPAVNFGTLTATTPVNRTSNLIVSNASAGGYVVTAMEDRPLRVNSSGATIPDTTCDNGLCTTTTSGPWIPNIDGSSTTYGFGYRCDNISGSDCASGFTTANYFKQFAASPSAVTVMQGTTAGRNRTVQITYRVNISQTQPSGLYTNVITYIVTPTF